MQFQPELLILSPSDRYMGLAVFSHVRPSHNSKKLQFRYGKSGYLLQWPDATSLYFDPYTLTNSHSPFRPMGHVWANGPRLGHFQCSLRFNLHTRSPYRKEIPQGHLLYGIYVLRGHLRVVLIDL